MSSECDRFEMAISAYVDGELPATEVRTLFLHLADCENCRDFWAAIRDMERRTLKNEWTVPSEDLDRRVESIPLREKGRKYAVSERPIPLRSAGGEHRHAEAKSLGRRRMSYRSVAAGSLLAVILGIVLGMTQPWSRVGASTTEPQVVYVSVLPSSTVIGHINQREEEGERK